MPSEPSTTHSTSTGAGGGAPADTPDRPRRRFTLPPWTGALVALVLLVGYTCYHQASTGDGAVPFLRPVNLFNILENNAPLGLLAVGMTLAVVLRGIDLSVGSLMAFAGGLAVMTLNRLYTAPPLAGQPEAVWPVVACAAVAVGVGAVAGLLNGLAIAKGRVAPFIVTLAGLLAFRSAAQWLANGGNIPADPSGVFRALGAGYPIPGTNVSTVPARVTPLQFPYAVAVWLVVAAVAAVVLHRTRLGRYVTAIGSNERAAVYSAIPVDRVKLVTYVLLGMTAGLAGLMNAANFASVNTSQVGLYLELYAIAAVVIGGTRMEGGAGTIAGTVIGVVLLGVIRNTMVMLGVTTYAQGIVTGLIIVAAVLVQRVWRR